MSSSGGMICHRCGASISSATFIDGRPTCSYCLPDRRPDVVKFNVPGKEHWNGDYVRELQAKLSAAEKERDEWRELHRREVKIHDKSIPKYHEEIYSLRDKLAVAVGALEHLEQAPFGHDFRTSAREALKAIGGE